MTYNLAYREARGASAGGSTDLLLLYADRSGYLCHFLCIVDA